VKMGQIWVGKRTRTNPTLAHFRAKETFEMSKRTQRTQETNPRSLLDSDAILSGRYDGSTRAATRYADYLQFFTGYGSAIGAFVMGFF
jgi:hypothetical protein